MENYLEHGMRFPSQCHFFESFATHIDRMGHSNIIGFISYILFEPFTIIWQQIIRKQLF